MGDFRPAGPAVVLDLAHGRRHVLQRQVHPDVGPVVAISFEAIVAGAWRTIGRCRVNVEAAALVAEALVELAGEG